MPHSINPKTGLVTVLRSMQSGYFEHSYSPPAPVPLTNEHGFMCAKGLGEDDCRCRPTKFNFKLPNSLAGPTDFPPHSSGSISISSKHALNDCEKVTSMRDIHVNRNSVTPPHLSSPYPHIFVVGDAADAFGALNAGHTAWAQAEVASRNVVRMIESNGRARVFDNTPPPGTYADTDLGIQMKSKGLRKEGKDVTRGSDPAAAATSVLLRTKTSTSRNQIWTFSPVNVQENEEKGEESEDGEPIPELEHYTAPLPSIKISIGLDKAIYQSKGNFGFKGPEECPIDLNSGGMWKRR